MPSARPPLRARKLRDLDLTRVDGREPAFLSAASGLVRSGGELYVVADDELHLGRFEPEGGAPGSLMRLLDGKLPERPAARKRRKADLEILMRLPALPGFAHGALLALGSGSRPPRERGALVQLDEDGRARGVAAEVDATPLHRQLAREFGKTNIEGAWLDGPRLRLLQRGNHGGGVNAIVDFDFSLIAATLANERVLPDLPPLRITPMRLGQIAGVGLSFTDACALPDGSWLFSAAAEDTADAYADGAFQGAALGMVTREAEIIWQRTLEPVGKVEGIHGERTTDGLRVLCVTDADDRSVPAQLLEVCIGPRDC
jgi:hypothetical protein